MAKTLRFVGASVAYIRSCFHGITNRTRTGERRASAGENLFTSGAVEDMNHLAKPAATGSVSGGVEEEGEG